jgi:hypothetical protein
MLKNDFGFMWFLFGMTIERQKVLHVNLSIPLYLCHYEIDVSTFFLVFDLIDCL